MSLAKVLPSRKSNILSACFARSGSCVTINIDIGFSSSLHNLLNNSMISLPLAISRLPVGSSARRRIGFLISALAIAILCCSPPDNKPGLINFLFVKPSFARRVKDFFLRHQKILHLK